MSPDYCQEIQDDVWGLLTNDASFRYIPVYRSRTPLEKDSEGNPIVGQTEMINEQIEQILGGMAFKDGKCGIVAIVMLPDAAPESANSPGPTMRYTIMVRVHENRLFNEGAEGTGISSGRLANHIMQMLHNRPLNGQYLISTDGDKTITEISLPDDMKAHEVRMVVTRAQPTLPKVAPPVPVLAEGILTVTCTTADALIYWSLNGSWPGPANPNSWLYELPIDLTTDPTISRVRVVAYDAAGLMQPSHDVSVAVG